MRISMLRNLITHTPPESLLFCTIQSIFTFFSPYLSHRLPQPVPFKRKIASELSLIPGKLDILFYTPVS
jgi:hypothetical protein